MLPKASRLTLKQDFEIVRQKGKFIRTPLFTVSYFNNKNEITRFGFIVSKKVSVKATERNKIKRLMREIIRLNLGKTKKGMDYVIIAKSSALHVPRAKLSQELINVIDSI